MHEPEPAADEDPTTTGPRPPSEAPGPRVAAGFRARGTVQGVGFRPWVHRTARALGLAGWVANDGGGVVGHVEGPRGAVDAFVAGLADAPPPAAVTAVDRWPEAPGAAAGFAVRPGGPGGGERTLPVPDRATCDACRAELGDPSSRHHRDPFTSCATCGPRWTVTTGIPWDRDATTLAPFGRCPDCERAYRDPSDRRFGAEASTCPACGPRLRLLDGPSAGDAVAHGDAALTGALERLAAGLVVAVKGVGGFHLAVAADDPRAVAALRSRKQRDDKPFAVLVADLPAARALCRVDDEEAALLGSPAAPIVLCRRRGGDGPTVAGHAVADAVAPGRRELGLLLPPSGLHELLARGAARPLVLTSANPAGAPIVHRDDRVAHLEGLADSVLTHDRAIAAPAEDSVVRMAAGCARLVRRDRGWVPEPLPLPVPAPAPVLALGAELKATCCVAVGDRARCSGPVGDLDHPDAVDAHQAAARRLVDLLDVRPAVVAHDLHPDVASTRLARRLADEWGAPTVAVQHHHAHVAAVLAEHRRPGPVLGLALDGLGLGDDGTWWGGELLHADLCRAVRVGHLAPVPLPGGAAAVREPWRMAASHLDAAGRPAPAGDPAWAAVVSMARTGTNSPPTSGAGRLFDAVAHVVTGRRIARHEGQAAIELEQLVPPGADPADRHDLRDAIATAPDGRTMVLPSSGFVAAAADDVAAGVPPAVVAARFHHGLAEVLATAAVLAARRLGLATVALAGGVLQNRVLLESLSDRLAAAGLEVLAPALVPANDGAVSYGQAAVAAARAAQGPQ